MNCQNTIYCVCLISGSIDTLRICQQSRQQSCQQSCDKHGLVIALLWRTSVVVVITWVTTGSQSGCLPKRHPASPLGAHRSDNPRRYWVLTDVPPCVATMCPPKRHRPSPLGAHRSATPRRHWVLTEAPPRVAIGCSPNRHPAWRHSVRAFHYMYQYTKSRKICIKLSFFTRDSIFNQTRVLAYTLRTRTYSLDPLLLT